VCSSDLTVQTFNSEDILKIRYSMALQATKIQVQKSDFDKSFSSTDISFSALLSDLELGKR
jgi:hypothetical protein